MIKVLLFDFSRTLLHPKDKNYKDSLNDLYNSLLQKEKYDFFEYFELNHEILDFLKTIKNKYHLYILSTKNVQNAPEIRKILHAVFDEIFSAKDLGFSKKDPEIYRHIAKTLNKKTDEIIFIDDTIANIQAAEKAGLKTIHYNTNAQTIRALENL